EAKAALPENAAASIRQRVAALPTSAREVLQVAAVAGRSITMPRLLAVARGGRRGEERGLAALEATSRARLLVAVKGTVAGRDGGPGLGGGDAVWEERSTSYQFAHDLVRELVSADLSAARRAVLHRRIAAVLEAEPGESEVELLAYHYGRSGDKMKAIVWW